MWRSAVGARNSGDHSRRSERDATRPDGGLCHAAAVRTCEHPRRPADRARNAQPRGVLRWPDGELNTGRTARGTSTAAPPTATSTSSSRVSPDIPIGSHGLAVSLTAGRGFARSASDDPMDRTFPQVSVNNHLSRFSSASSSFGALRAGAADWRAESSTAMSRRTRAQPEVSRFGDSWSARATVHPFRGVELSASMARVESPEFVRASGSIRKASAVSASSWENASRSESPILLAEWARTHDDRSGRRVFTFTTFLAEAGVHPPRPLGRASPGADETRRKRRERSIPSQSRPQIEFRDSGTCWTVVTAAAGTNGRRAGY